jgi:hypothetical protein
MSYKPPSKGFDPPTPYRPGANERPSTLPKDSGGQAINEDRRRRKAEEAEFVDKHGRKPTRKELKRLGRKGP